MTKPAHHRGKNDRRGRLIGVGAAVILALLITNLSIEPARADFESGVKAYDAGDFTTAYNDWLPIAAGGDAFAQRNIGHLYRLGLGVPQNFEVAFKWYQRAAGKGLVRAQANLANMLLRGQGVDQDPKEAAEWFHRAATAGHAISQFNIGQMYRKGLAVPQDAAKALGWLQLAADAGHERSIELVAIMSAEGIEPAAGDALLAPPFGRAAAPTEPAQADSSADETDDNVALKNEEDDEEDDTFGSILADDDDADEATDANRIAATDTDDAATPADDDAAAPADDDAAGDDTLGGSDDDEDRPAPAQVAALPAAQPTTPTVNDGAIVGGDSGGDARPAQPTENLEESDDLLGDDDLLSDDDDAATPAAQPVAPPQVAARAPEPLTRQPRISDEAMAAAVSEGLKAYQGKDYTTALRTWLPLAQAGNRDAQFFVGGLYMDGAGVPEDRVRAHAWWRLAADQGHTRASEFLEVIVAIMTPEQMTEAGELATELQASIR
ncbi:MAG: hypothetical protein O3C65_00900 [Proteobacteria bacterium]|nr:hypothetical protein [Pseudomonadota bacterium]MDA1057215.1 hypothetical protein [Pseudomonadota bacterium]